MAPDGNGRQHAHVAEERSGAERIHPVAALVIITGIPPLIRFHDRFAGIDDFWIGGMDDHAIRNLRRTCNDKFWNLFDLDQADAAIAGDGKLGMPAKMRDLYPILSCRLDNRSLLINVQLFSIYRNLCHVGSSYLPGKLRMPCTCSSTLRLCQLPYVTFVESFELNHKTFNLFLRRQECGPEVKCSRELPEPRTWDDTDSCFLKQRQTII